MKSLIPFRPRAQKVEWAGGQYTFPNEIQEGRDVFRPEIVLWLELPSEAIVGTKLIDPRKPVMLAESLEEAMKKPAVGASRRPTRIRVPTEQMAEELRGAVSREVEIVVAPVPEVDAAFADLSQSLSNERIDAEPELSYLGGGSIEPEVVAALFSTASLLFRTAPWRFAAEYQVLRVDIPALGIDGACLSIIGGAGESFGLLLFRSLETYRAFAMGPPSPGAASGPGGKAVLHSLSFDRKKDLPPQMVREIEHHRWPLAGAKAYPVVFSVDGDMQRLPLTVRDLRIMTVCTRAFLAFFARNRRLFDQDALEPICESITGDDDVTVTLTAPYGEETLFGPEALFELDDPPPVTATARPAVGRNDPCPCGSGKKYKKCHLDADLSSTSAPTPTETVHEMDFRLVRDIWRFASSRFGPAWLERIGVDIDDDESLLQLFPQWAAWTAVVDGMRIADRYVEQIRPQLSDKELGWIEEQKRAWLSIWEVTRVEPGTIEVRDLLTAERRSVREELASRVLVARDTVLARLIDFQGAALFGGMYGRALPPADSVAVINAVRAKLRARKGDVAIGSLQDPLIGRFLIERWRDAVDEHDERAAIPPVLQNTDGDPLLFVTESFRFDAAARPEIEKRLAAMDGVDKIQLDKKESEIVFVREGNRLHKSWENTVVGRVLVTSGTLRIETNSEKRAEDMARRVRDACAGMLRNPKRKVEKPPTVAKAAPSGAKKPGMSAKEQALLRAAKELHYRDWIDTPLPALGGKTPRAAARSQRSREQLDLLLRQMENLESRLPEAARFDVRRLRGELGLEP